MCLSCVLYPCLDSVLYTHAHTHIYMHCTKASGCDPATPLYVMSETGHNLTWHIMTETITWYHAIMASRLLTETAWMHSILNRWGICIMQCILLYIWWCFVLSRVALHGNGCGNALCFLERSFCIALCLSWGQFTQVQLTCPEDPWTVCKCQC